MLSPDLTLVIVSFQVSAHLERCLTSLARVASVIRLQIVVVDNASTDGSMELVRDKFPGVELIANAENVGFARANNQGLQVAQGRYWMLLNPDTELADNTPNPLSRLIEFMEVHPRAGACGSSLFYPDGTRQHSAFRFPTLAQIYMDLYPVNWRLRTSRLNGRYPTSLYDRGEPFQIDHPLGAALLIRPAAVQQVGLLDEDYYIYAEEVDWCMRLKRAGWEIWCVPAARITHYEAQSSRQFRDKMFVELWRSRFTLFRKQYSRSFNRAASALVQWGMNRAVQQTERERRQGSLSAEAAAQRIGAYKQVLALAKPSATKGRP